MMPGNVKDLDMFAAACGAIPEEIATTLNDMLHRDATPTPHAHMLMLDLDICFNLALLRISNHMV